LHLRHSFRVKPGSDLFQEIVENRPQAALQAAVQAVISRINDAQSLKAQGNPHWYWDF
jgi:predicted DNA-binding protein with PD1-like motif